MSIKGENGRIQTEEERIDDVLLNTLGMGFDAQKLDRYKNLSTDQWDAIFQEATRHGIAPLVYRRLKPFASKIEVSPDTFQKLEKQYLWTAARNTRLYHEFSKIVRLMKSRGILVIALKGIYLADAVYRSFALRSMGDIDLLVKKSDLHKTEEVMSELGYNPIEYNRIISDDNVHFTYAHTKTRLSVEIHWTVLPPDFFYGADIEGLWERSRPTVIAGSEVLIFSPEDQILFLCFHISKHTFLFGLRSLFDLVMIASHFRNEVDWEVLSHRAHQCSATRTVYLTLRLARELLQAEVPEQLIEDLKPTPFEERIFDLARRAIFGQKAKTADGLVLSPNISQLWSDKGFREKMTSFLKRTFPSRHEMGRIYPAHPDSLRIFLYYPVRMRELLFRYGRQSWRLLRGEREMISVLEQENVLNSLRDWIMSP